MGIFSRLRKLFNCGTALKPLRVLIIVDVQKTFCSGGGLAVPDADAIVARINELKAKGNYDLVILTQDAHPENHGSFASSHFGKKIFEQIQLNGVLQTLWPKHGCPTVKGYPSNRSDEEKAAHPDESAEFHDELDTSDAIVFPKGTDFRVDSYSGFFDNGRRASDATKVVYNFLGKSTGLGEYISKLAGKRPVHVDVVGLALDFCVKFTALDAQSLGYKVRVIADATRSTALNTPEATYRELTEGGCEVVYSDAVLEQFAALFIGVVATTTMTQF